MNKENKINRRVRVSFNGSRWQIEITDSIFFMIKLATEYLKWEDAFDHAQVTLKTYNKYGK